MRVLCILALAAAWAAPAAAQDAISPPDIREARGHVIPDVELIAEDSTVFRTALLQGKPLIVSPIFTSCPHTCSYITSSLRDALAEIGEPGVGYEVLTLSFDPADGPAQLREYRERLALPAGWRLAVATPENLTALLDAIDFQYRPMDEGGFAHANAIAIIDPEMKVAGYMHGVTYESAALRTELEKAVRGTSLVWKARPLLVAIALLGVAAVVFALVSTRRKHGTASAVGC